MKERETKDGSKETAEKSREQNKPIATGEERTENTPRQKWIMDMKEAGSGEKRRNERENTENRKEGNSSLKGTEGRRSGHVSLRRRVVKVGLLQQTRRERRKRKKTSKAFEDQKEATQKKSRTFSLLKRLLAFRRVHFPMNRGKKKIMGHFLFRFSGKYT